ncbi:MAG: helix-turn-helix transcriptional regulator [Clostridiales bacterium]|nr:helix-turn-helix transcriptional regulator [Clostridiales bacterium]
MSNECMARLIQEKRKAGGMTQKQLAEKLGVTDKAVSKWERGIGCPDISLLMPLAKALGVPVQVLLNGPADDGEAELSPPSDSEQLVNSTLSYADRAITCKREALMEKIALLLVLASLTAMAVCLICDAAVTGGVSWSLYPIGSLVLACCVTVPLLVFRRHRFYLSLLVLTLLLVPYLWLVLMLAGAAEYLWPLAVPVSFFSLLYAWTACFLLHSRLSRWTSAGILVFLIPVLDIAVDLTVDAATGENNRGMLWSLASALLTTAAALFLFWMGRRHGRGQK